MAQSTRAYTELRSLIVSWDLPPGSPLNEVQLAERLGISRTPLRQAIQRLAHEGLVRLTPGRGAQVSEITLQDVVSLFQMREALETYAARLCARRPDRARFADLQAAFETQRAQFETGEPEGGDYGPYYALIAQLDEAVDAGARNPYLLSSLASLRGHLERLRQIARRRPRGCCRPPPSTRPSVRPYTRATSPWPPRPRPCTSTTVFATSWRCWRRTSAEAKPQPS